MMAAYCLRDTRAVVRMLGLTHVILRPRPDDFTATLRGLHQTLWEDSDAWLEEERATWERTPS